VKPRPVRVLVLIKITESYEDKQAPPDANTLLRAGRSVDRVKELGLCRLEQWIKSAESLSQLRIKVRLERPAHY
jgi:hypothetical protein